MAIVKLVFELEDLIGVKILMGEDGKFHENCIHEIRRGLCKMDGDLWVPEEEVASQIQDIFFR